MADITNLPFSENVEDRRSYVGPPDVDAVVGNPAQRRITADTVNAVNKTARDANDRVSGLDPDHYDNKGAVYLEGSIPSAAPDEVMDYIQRQRQDAQVRVLQGADANPQDAARAEELSKASGAPSALIAGDLENFEKQHKAALASQIIGQNSFLRD